MEINDEGLSERLIELGFGIEKEGRLMLSPLEVAYLHQEGLLEESKEVDEKLLKVYATLRNRGYIVRESGEWLRIFKKGYRRGEDRSFAILKVVDGKVELEELDRDFETSKNMKKELVYAYLKEGEVRFFSPIKRSFP